MTKSSQGKTSAIPDTDGSIASYVASLRLPSRGIESLLGHDMAHRAISVAYVQGIRDDYIELYDVSVGGVVDALLGQHLIQRNKEQNGCIWARLDNGRRNADVKSVQALVYDIDGKMSYGEVCQRAARFGAAIFTYTTWNHRRTETWLPVAGDVTSVTSEQAANLCAANTTYDHLRSIVVLNDGLVSIVKKRGKDVSAVAISHEPEEKTRVVMFLREPIPISELGLDGYPQLYHAVGTALFGSGVYDTACKNPSRVQWLPAHAENSSVAHQRNFHAGDVYDWRAIWNTIKPQVQEQRERSSKQATARLKQRERDGGAGGGDRAIREIAQCLAHIPASSSRPDWFRVLAAIHNETGGGEHGLSLAHEWSATAPELYDEEEVEAIWEGFTSSPSGGKKAGMGTLIYMARQNHPTSSPKAPSLALKSPRNYRIIE